MTIISNSKEKEDRPNSLDVVLQANKLRGGKGCGNETPSVHKKHRK